MTSLLKTRFHPGTIGLFWEIFSTSDSDSLHKAAATFVFSICQVLTMSSPLRRCVVTKDILPLSSDPDILFVLPYI